MVLESLVITVQLPSLLWEMVTVVVMTMVVMVDDVVMVKVRVDHS